MCGILLIVAHNDGIARFIGGVLHPPEQGSSDCYATEGLYHLILDRCGSGYWEMVVGGMCAYPSVNERLPTKER